jgi:hypothetical protein
MKTDDSQSPLAFGSLFLANKASLISRKFPIFVLIFQYSEQAEEQSKQNLLAVFKDLGYEIKL